MIIGIIMAVLGLTLCIVASIKDWGPVVGIGLAAAICIGGVLGFAIKVYDEPSISEAHYSTVVDATPIYFDNYTMSTGEIKIPSHYYAEYSWINTWEYCNAPIVVVIPEVAQVVIKDRNIEGITPTKPYIVGGCK